MGISVLSVQKYLLEHGKCGAISAGSTFLTRPMPYLGDRRQWLLMIASKQSVPAIPFSNQRFSAIRVFSRCSYEYRMAHSTNSTFTNVLAWHGWCIYTEDFTRIVPLFSVPAPVIRAQTFQKVQAQVKVWFGTDEIWYSAVI